MKKNRIRLAFAAVFALAFLVGCSGGDNPEVKTPKAKRAENMTSTPTPAFSAKDIDYSGAEEFGEAPVFNETGHFYEGGIDLFISNSAANGILYYTFDGSEPYPGRPGSYEYENPLSMEPTEGNYPQAYVIKAKSFYADGTVSPTAVHTFFVSEGIRSRFTSSSDRLLIVSMVGDAADFTESPDGLLYGQNYKLRGDASERPCHVEIFDAEGNTLVSQYAGARIYGAYSRQNAVKSFKLFARKEYGSGIGKFKYDFFGTTDTEGNPVDSYDKLVLRSYGNDWQFAFLRDELNQRLLGKAGYDCYEEVRPAIVYLNGMFYNFVWMHESYCDTYFKQKFPDDSMNGTFVVIGGKETRKDPDEDRNDVFECNEFNAVYDQLRDLDFTIDSNYARLCAFMDVENYLDYYAANIFVCNYDWPHNNYKVYRYYADDLGDYGEGVYDGRWRFLPHDMDYCYNIYNRPEECPVTANYLATVLSEGQRNAPLFAAILKRTDCRNYFIRSVLRLIDGAFSYESICDEIDTMVAEQGDELAYYIEAMKKTYNGRGGWGGDPIWTSINYVGNSRETIREFARERGDILVTQMAEVFNMDISDILALMKG